ncbi:carboxypeptidase-like regulatory domain-containing protein, partial [Chitinophaga sp.]|uniref:carboxypeptidase-like regulatory domain-containing protein n=1 Tax=Chitinophaga sp. TaxID=1869181 RepID=UPI002F92FA62
MKKTGISIAIAIMKLSAIPLLILVTFLNVYAAKTLGQEVLDRKITITVNQQALKDVLKEVGRKSKVRFFYSPEMIGTDRKISAEAKDETLAVFLDRLLTPLSIKMEVTEKGDIFLSRASFEANAQTAMSGTSHAAAPPKTISGKVRAADGTILVGATLQVKGTSKGTTTNEEGNFSLAIPEGAATLVVSAVGYETTEVEISEDNVY